MIFSPQVKSLRLPDILTLLGILSSGTAFFLLWFGGEAFPFMVYVFILLQLTFDVLDGRLARKMKIASGMGVHLDNFADFFTIMVVLIFGITLGIDHLLMFPIFAFYILAAAIRLAYFTIQKEVSPNVFTGLPTTAVSFFLSTLLLLNHSFDFFQVNFMLFFYALCALLMISSLRIPKL